MGSCRDALSRAELTPPRCRLEGMHVMVLPLTSSRLSSQQNTGGSDPAVAGAPPAPRLELPAGAAHREEAPAVINSVFGGAV